MPTPILLNRNGAFVHPDDGWYMIEPYGEHPNRRAGVVQVIDAEAGQAIADAFNRDAAAPGFAGMLIDHEHFGQDADKESRAYGWLMGVQNRADGLYGQIRWTETGRKAVDGGDYRFFSTEYDAKDLAVLNSDSEKPRRVRPLRLDGLTVTNKPNNRKGAKPITNREGDDVSNRFPAAGGDLTETKENDMKDIAKLLGLSEDAAPEAVSAAITKLQNRVSTMEAEQVDGLLAAHGIEPTQPRHALVKDALLKLNNREAREQWLNDVCPKADAKPATPPQNKLFNRDTKPPMGGSIAGDTDEAKAARIQNRAKVIQAEHRCSFADAFATATREAAVAN